MHKTPDWEEYRRLQNPEWKVVRGRQVLAQGRGPLVIDERGRVWPAGYRTSWDGQEEGGSE